MYSAYFEQGRWYGFVTGLGASLSDIAYALLTGYGMSFVFDYINKNIFLSATPRKYHAIWLLVFIHSAAILCNPFGLYRPIKVLISTTSLPPLQLHFPIRLLFFFSSVCLPVLLLCNPEYWSLKRLRAICHCPRSAGVVVWNNFLC